MERVVLKGEDPYYDRFAISQVQHTLPLLENSWIPPDGGVPMRRASKWATWSTPAGRYIG